MKALSYISIPILLLTGSCASTLYTGADYDDLYYSGSDIPAASERVATNSPMNEQELRADTYYDNIYAGDTLVSDKYSVPSDYDAQIQANNSVSGGSGFDYYDDSYANRLSMFYGNYFNPYWQDPFYFNFGYGFGSPYFGFGFNYGYPYYGLGLGFGYGFGYPYYYGYSPYYWDPFYYGYGGYWGYPYYGYGYYPYYRYSEGRYASYGRRERPSTMSSRYNENMGMAGSRRGSGSTYDSYSGTGRRSSPGSQQAFSPDARRSSTQTAVARSGQDVVRRDAASRSSSSAQGSQIMTKPEYRDANRTYTPSYNNPRMSTRPSYNNSRVPETSGSRAGESRSFNSTAPARSSQNRVINQSSQRSGSFNNMQRRYSTPSSSTRIYSTPSRRSTESSRSYSSGSSRSSFGRGSSSFSRSSYSGGSSSGSSGGGRSSSSSHSSGGRR